MVNNRSLSQRDGMTLKAMGMVRGVSDLVFVDDGKVFFLEVKMPGKRHDSDHVRNQMRWGSDMSALGNEWMILTCVSDIINVVSSGGIGVKYTLKRVKQLMENHIAADVIFEL